MKIVVKSTKTISFDENFEDDESSEHENNEEADEQIVSDFGIEEQNKSSGSASGQEQNTKNEVNETTGIVEKVKEPSVMQYVTQQEQPKRNKSSSFNRQRKNRDKFLRKKRSENSPLLEADEDEEEDYTNNKSNVAEFDIKQNLSNGFCRNTETSRVPHVASNDDLIREAAYIQHSTNER